MNETQDIMITFTTTEKVWKMYEMFLLDSSFFCWKEERFYKYITKPTLDDFSLNLYFYSYAAIVYVLIIVQIYYNQKNLF